MEKMIKASQLMNFLKRAIDTYGDVGVAVEVCDYSDSYSVKEHTVPVERVYANSTMELKEGTELDASIKLVAHIGR